jgi:hypothetical protein
MPRGNGAGPNETVTMTGKGAGNCAGGPGRGRMNRGSSKGAAGRGLCGWFSASELAGHSPEDNEEALLKAESDALSKRQEEINQRLSELRK